MVRKAKQKTPAISVVIPAYNEEELLLPLLQSLREQTYRDFEVIVIDNNSTDKTATVARHFHARVITEYKQGYVHALNRGIKDARGTILAITDADSLPDADWLMAIADSFKDPEVIALTGHAKFDINSAILRYMSEYAYLFFTRLNFLIGKPHTAGFNLAFKRAYSKKIGILDPAYHIGADVYMGLALKKHGKVIFSKKAIVKTSSRRWQKEAVKSFSQYSAAYLYTVWFHRPAPIKLLAIR